MNDFVTITPDGRFALGGKRWMCNSTIYFGRAPGTCATDWFTGDRWERNAATFNADFEMMSSVGINHAAIFLHNDMFFDSGKLIAQGFDRLDHLVEAAKRQDIRVSLFVGPFIDKPEVFQQITGETWADDDRWLPAFNPRLHDAYVRQAAPLAERYKNEPAVMAYTDRIDRFHKGFDNVTIPHNLKAEWHAWLKERYGSFKSLLDAVGGAEALENRPRDFGDVQLPQESQFNGSLKNPLAFDYILMQKKVTGEAHARFDAAIKRIAPKQFIWTPFEGNTNTWAMLDGFSPETKKLQAIWMEYYFFEMTRPSLVQPFEEWTHTREIHHSRLSHQLPVIYTAAYSMCRYLKRSVQQPVVICHGGWIESPAYGTKTAEHQAAIVDRVNAACLAADGDGWHYWDWRDDEASHATYLRALDDKPTLNYFAGESLGLLEFDGRPRPALSVAVRYSREAQRRADDDRRAALTDVLLLSSSPRMYNLFRRLALPTACAVAGALARLGAQPDYLWTSQNDVRITQETLDAYKLIVLADNMYERDFRDTPEKLLRFVERGGTLYLPLDRFDSFKDEHGVTHRSEAIAKLSGVDPNGSRDWPGTAAAINWPWPTPASQEPNMDVQAFPRLAWGVCPKFRAFVTYPHRQQLLGFRSLDGDTFTPVPGLVKSAETIAVGKFPAGTVPFVWRHRIGKGTIYVNAWTNNLFRDNEQRHDYGGWDYDWMLDLPLQTSGARDIDLTRGASIWLRNSWGYFWQEI